MNISANLTLIFNYQIFTVQTKYINFKIEHIVLVACSRFINPFGEYVFSRDGKE